MEILMFVLPIAYCVLFALALCLVTIRFYRAFMATPQGRYIPWQIAILVIIILGWILFTPWFILWGLLIVVLEIAILATHRFWHWLWLILLVITFIIGGAFIRSAINVDYVKGWFASAEPVAQAPVDTSDTADTVAPEAVEPTAKPIEAEQIEGYIFGYKVETKAIDICASLNSLPVDPSSIPYPLTDRELDKNISETFNGPGILEWWYGGNLEGVWQIASGETITLTRGVAGHWFPLSSDADMKAAWPLHVCNYSKKPQHAAKLLYGDLVINPVTAIDQKN